ncbi:MAG: alpha/beta hydrolase [Pseudomonadota bacterium]|nr:alpha/beta hydrolase [Pseudomonadota bacterium]
MPAWFDIYDISETGPIDKPGIEDSISNIQGIIDEELAKGVKPENIILAGFSQGGTIALHAGLRYPKKLGGIIALSTYMPLANELKDLRTESNASTPVFIAHGLDDSLVPLRYGKQAAKLLQEWGNPVTWHQYPMFHSVCNEEVEDISKWLQACWN